MLSKSKSRLEKSLKKHVKQYEINVIKRDNDYISKDKDLISNENYNPKQPLNYFDFYKQNGGDSRAKDLKKSRRQIYTAGAFSNERIAQSKAKDIRIHTTSGTRVKTIFNGAKSEILDDKRCKTAANNIHGRIKSNINIHNPEQTLHMATNYELPRETVKLKTNSFV